ncbi:hypothetical protein E2C01_022150 [Portunus trituberculatus]|uniref:Uncharacterized protein n=1 Tax=Portunus trituberculatus TaxID=210409 RepID=A0A5B7E850_PORTR|nr:hypothetical protein [Portunus trituberculatus]
MKVIKIDSNTLNKAIFSFPRKGERQRAKMFSQQNNSTPHNKAETTTLGCTTGYAAPLHSTYTRLHNTNP